MRRAIGIDLGTTYSLVAAVMDGTARVIPDPTGDVLMPSIVSFPEVGPVAIGRDAERRLLVDPGRTVYSVKRFMGKGIDDVGDEARLFPYRIGGEPGGALKIGVGGAPPALTPPQISAFVLRALRYRAEIFFAKRGRIRSGRFRRRHHRARLLQRCAAHRDTRCRPPRRSRSASHHQRADRGGARLRPGHDAPRA